MVNCCGLLTVKNEPVPLKQVEVAVQVQGHVASVTSTLQYENAEESPLEAVFVFPLEEDAALCHFSAKIGETEVVAELQEKEKAREQYDDALSSGQQAFLLEESEESSDVFQLSVGSLPPGEKAEVTLVYVIELAVQADEALRFCLPAVLNPRYAPRDSGAVPQVSSAPGGSVPYTLSLRLQVSSPSPISKVESNCPLEPLQYLNAEKTQAEVSLSAGHMFDRDVELMVYYSDAHKPTAIAEMGKPDAQSGSLMGDPVIMLSLYPEFPAAVKSSLASCGEFIFLVDRSGSMDSPMHHGQGAQMRIESARDTLLLLLKSLPMGCFFNIYGFGSSHDSFFPKSVEYSQKTMENALKMVKGMKADLGGTEILSPLQHIYSLPCLPEQPRQLFIFTDGEVWNTKDILDLVKRNAFSHRCFSFGIGEGASTALIKGMAKEGSGHAQFITGTERLQPKVMQSLRFALQPSVKDVSLKWNVPDGVSVTPLSPPINALFQGQRSLQYAQLTGQFAEAVEGSVSLQYSLADQSVQNQLGFRIIPGENTGLTIHRLGARTLIRTLETDRRMSQTNQFAENDPLRKRVIELSVQSGVSSSLTAFIAVHAGNKQPVKGAMVRRDVPTGALFGQCSPMAYCAAPMSRMMACSAPRMAGSGGMMMKCAMPKMAARKSKGKMKGGGIMMARAMPKMVACKSKGKMKGGIFSKLKKKVSSFEVTEADGVVGDLCCDYGEDDSFCSAFPTADEETAEPQRPKDLLLQLISLQKATGSWDLVADLVEVLGKTEEEVAKHKPPKVDDSVWATVLALLWLYGFREGDKDEWQLVAMKAASWVQAQAGSSVSQCIQAGNTLLGCQVKEQTLGQ